MENKIVTFIIYESIRLRIRHMKFIYFVMII